MTFRGMTLAAAAAFGAALMFATGASAATINVPGNNGKSIQDGVDLASPGDTVAVTAKKRAYFENVVVTTNRITIRGIKKQGRPVIVDGTSVDGTTHGLSFDIDADRVTVRNLSSRHGEGIDCTGDRCLFDRIAMSMSDNGSDCLEIIGNASAVRRSNLLGCDSAGVDVDGNGARVVKNSIRQADSGCVEVDGDRLFLVNNTLQSCEDDEPLQLAGDDATIRRNIGKNADYGFEISGNSNVISDNVARNFEDDANFDVSGDFNLLLRNRAIHSGGDTCIEVDGIANRIKLNRAQYCGDGGYDLSGENMKVVRNSVTDNGSGGDGFAISCSDETGGSGPAEACARAVVSGNLAADAGDDDEGFAIGDSSTDGGMLIRANQSRNNNDGGFETNTDAARIIGNSSRNDGAEGNEPGFDINGNGNRVEKNSAFATGDDGLSVDGDNNQVVQNVVRRSNIDGIQIVGGTDSTVRANRTIGNFGDGIENDGTDTNLIRNRSRGNRRDCVNDATVDEKHGNRCADGSNFNLASTVDRPAHRRR